MFFYDSTLPQTNDLVVVQVKKIDDVEIVVVLKEYGDKECMLNWKQVTRKYKHLKHTIRVDNNYVMEVVNVNVEKGYVDLTKYNITTEQEADTFDYFNKSKKIIDIIRSFSHKTNTDFDENYKEIAYPLYTSEFLDDYDHPLDFLIKVILDHTLVKLVNIHTLQAQIFLDVLENKIRISPNCVSKKISVTCYAEAGIMAIQEALRAAKSIDSRIKIHLEKSPIYSIKLESKDHDEDIQSILDKAILAAKKVMVAHKGALKVE